MPNKDCGMPAQTVQNIDRKHVPTEVMKDKKKLIVLKLQQHCNLCHLKPFDLAIKTIRVD